MNTRLNDTEYKNLFAKIETAETLDMDALNTLSYERTTRSFESLGGHRSQRSVLNVKFINLVNMLEAKHNCKLVGRNPRGSSLVVFERHEAGYNQWAWAK